MKKHAQAAILIDIAAEKHAQTAILGVIAPPEW